MLGPSGCGKTTVLKIIAGLVPPTSGIVKVDGVPVTGPQRKIGLVFQVPALMKWRTALENVLLPGEILGLDRAPRKSAPASFWTWSGLTDFSRAIPRELSGGMQQRVGIARALAHDPAILLARRAVQRARHDDAQSAQHRTAAHLERAQENQPADHPQHSGGGVPVRPGRGAGPAACQNSRHGAYFACHGRAMPAFAYRQPSWKLWIVLAA